MDVGKSSITSLIAGFARGLPFVLVAPSILHRPATPTSSIVVDAAYVNERVAPLAQKGDLSRFIL